MSDVRQLKEKREPLFKEVKKSILEQAKAHVFQDGKLPSEEVLCQMYNVSRATIREALGILHREGFISKRHGTGNVLNYSAIHASMRFDLDERLPQILEQGGYTVQTLRQDLHCNCKSNEFTLLPCNKLTISPWAEQITRHIVENKVAIFTQNLFSENIKKKFDINTNIAFSMLLQSLTGKEVSHTLQTFIPLLPPKLIIKEFEIEENIPCTVWHQTHFGKDDTLLCESFVYFNPTIVQLRSLTRWS